MGSRIRENSGRNMDSSVTILTNSATRRTALVSAAETCELVGPPRTTTRYSRLMHPLRRHTLAAILLAALPPATFATAPAQAPAAETSTAAAAVKPVAIELTA